MDNDNTGTIPAERHKITGRNRNVALQMEVEFPDAKVDDIYVVSDKVYAGIRGGGGLFVFDKKSFQPEKQVLQKKHPGANHVRAITPLDSATLLLGTNGPLLLFNRKSAKLKELVPPNWNYAGDWTNDIYKDRKENIWISANYIYKYDPHTKNFQIVSQSSPPVKCSLCH